MSTSQVPQLECATSKERRRRKKSPGILSPLLPVSSGVEGALLQEKPSTTEPTPQLSRSELRRILQAKNIIARQILDQLSKDFTVLEEQMEDLQEVAEKNEQRFRDLVKQSDELVRMDYWKFNPALIQMIIDLPARSFSLICGSDIPSDPIPSSIKEIESRDLSSEQRSRFDDIFGGWDDDTHKVFGMMKNTLNNDKTFRNHSTFIDPDINLTLENLRITAKYFFKYLIFVSKERDPELIDNILVSIQKAFQLDPSTPDQDITMEEDSTSSLPPQ